MATAVIVDAVRSPLGRRNGKLKDTHPVDLAAHSIQALVERTGIDPALVEDVIMGCVMQVGDQAVNVGRNAALAAGFPETVVGHVDRPPVRFVPAGRALRGAGRHRRRVRRRDRGGRREHDPRADGRVVHPGQHAVRAADAGALPEPRAPGHLRRADRGEVGHHRARTTTASRSSRTSRGRAATAEGRFEREIVPIGITGENGAETMSTDEGIRPDSSMETLAKLKPAFKPDGVVTAANSSQITDGSAALLIMSEEKANELGLTPRARFHTFALAGVDPVMMLTGPIPATTKVLERAGMKLDEMDLVEINEAFAPVVLSWEKEHHPDMTKVNVNGGAIALGPPARLRRAPGSW